ncbi:MAG: aldehyde dehydrogenase family protein [Bacteroidota bacterium]
MTDFLIYCAGEFITTENRITVRNPFDGSEAGVTYLAGQTELERAIKAATEAAPAMKEMPSYMRYKILMSIAEGIRKNKEHIAAVLSAEACKPIKNALVEVDRGIQTFIVAAEESKRLPMEYLRLDWTPAAAGREGLVKYFPVGLVAGISPFNFPLNLSAHKIAPAIAAGCPIILKPATSTPLTMLEVAKIIDATELPKGVVSILPMDRITGNLLVTDERFKLLTFTGSPEVGWKMKNDVGKKKVVLELGGNAGVIVTPSCDLESAVAKCVVGGFAYAGQVCIHTQRIYVHASVIKDFSKLFIAKVRLLKQGNPLDAETDISAMIDEANAIRVEQWVNDAIKEGAQLLCGGRRSGTMMEPTVLTATKRDMNVCCCEIFGPVVILESYNDFKEAVDRINDSAFGLQAGVFTNDMREADYAFNNIDAGGVIINDGPTFRVDHTPYGGIKDSGLGREGVKYAMLDMLEPKIMVK